jgi:hypothetical protein
LAFLRDEGNRALLGWIGGGLVVLATGLWAVFTFYVDHSKPPPPPATTIVEQKGTGFASGRDTTINAPVTINPDAKEVVAPISERLDKILVRVAREKGVEVAPLRSVLVKLGEAGVHDEDIPKRLDAAADELIKLRAKIEQFQHGAPAQAAIAEKAQTLIGKGDLDGARKLVLPGNIFQMTPTPEQMTRAPSMRSICSERYQAAHAAGTLNETWPQFYSRCTAEIRANPP